MKNRIAYVQKVITSIYQGIDLDQIGYGYDSTAAIRIYKSDTDLFDANRLIQDEEVHVIENKETLVPLILRDSASKLIEKHPDHIRLGFDMYAAAFYLLSGWQEYVSKDKDQYGRYRYQDSFQFKYDCVMVPVVNYYFEILMDAIESYSFPRPSFKTSEKESFTFYLSHDIDQCQSGWKQALKHELSGLRLGDAFQIISDKIRGRDPWWTFAEMMSGERAEGVRSTYYFLASKLLKGNVPHADYDIDSPAIKSLIQVLESQGDQIGIHGSFGTAEALEELRAESKLIESNGIRFHFLGWNQNETPTILNSLGFAHDSTLGFAEHIGFRNSCCHPFPLYDISNDEILQVVEYPLNIMDTTLYNSSYMNVAPAEVIKRVEPLIGEVEKFHGHLSILWHNNYFSKYKYNGWGDIYWELIQLLKRRKGKCLLPKLNRK